MYRITEARKAHGWSQQKLAEKFGTTQQQIARWESGVVDPRADVVVKLSGILGVTVSHLLGVDGDGPAETSHRMHNVPVLGRIAAGDANEAVEQAGEFHATRDSLWEEHPSAFWLVVSGQSMNRLFPEGALVLVDPALDVRDGDVGAVFVNGDDATLKRVYYESGAVRLHPESYDPEYRDRVIKKDDPDAPMVRTIGRVVSYTAPDGWRA